MKLYILFNIEAILISVSLSILGFITKKMNVSAMILVFSKCSIKLKSWNKFASNIGYTDTK